MTWVVLVLGQRAPSPPRKEANYTSTPLKQKERDEKILFWGIGVFSLSAEKKSLIACEYGNPPHAHFYSAKAVAIRPFSTPKDARINNERTVDKRVIKATVAVYPRDRGTSNNATASNHTPCTTFT